VEDHPEIDVHDPILCLADFITLANAGFGMAAIFLCLNHVTDSVPRTSGCLSPLPLALVCDVLDGSWLTSKAAIASWGDLDSLADIVSFGVAPAVLDMHWDCKACGCPDFDLFRELRNQPLARFNATGRRFQRTGKVKYYEGLHPASIIIVIVLGIAYWQAGSIISSLWSIRIGPWVFHRSRSLRGERKCDDQHHPHPETLRNRPLTFPLKDDPRLI